MPGNSRSTMSGVPSGEALSTTIVSTDLLPNPGWDRPKTGPEKLLSPVADDDDGEHWTIGGVEIGQRIDPSAESWNASPHSCCRP